MPICSLAADTRRSAAAMSGRRCSSVDGTPTGTSGTVGAHWVGASVKSAGALPIRTAIACSSWARWFARPRSSLWVFCSWVWAWYTSECGAMPASKRFWVIFRTRW